MFSDVQRISRLRRFGWCSFWRRWLRCSWVHAMMDFPWDFMEISYGFNGKWCLSDVKIGDVMEHHDDIIGYIYTWQCDVSGFVLKWGKKRYTSTKKSLTFWGTLQTDPGSQRNGEDFFRSRSIVRCSLVWFWQPILCWYTCMIMYYFIYNMIMHIHIIT